MSAHPLDEWVEVTRFGQVEPQYLLARDGREVAIAQAKAEYVEGRITIEEFEARVGEALA